MPLTIKYMLLS